MAKQRILTKPIYFPTNWTRKYECIQLYNGYLLNIAHYTWLKLNWKSPPVHSVAIWLFTEHCTLLLIEIELKVIPVHSVAIWLFTEHCTLHLIEIELKVIPCAFCGNLVIYWTLHTTPDWNWTESLNWTLHTAPDWNWTESLNWTLHTTPDWNWTESHPVHSVAIWLFTEHCTLLLIEIELKVSPPCILWQFGYLLNIAHYSWLKLNWKFLPPPPPPHPVHSVAIAVTTLPNYHLTT